VALRINGAPRGGMDKCQRDDRVDEPGSKTNGEALGGPLLLLGNGKARSDSGASA
jgi:hypothetical protein